MKFVVALIALISVTFTAHAGLLIEPVLGYNVISKFDDDSGGSGSAFGGRLGYQYLGLQLGIDYLNSTMDSKIDNAENDFKTNEFGAFVGFEFPVFFRIYAGYVFSASSDKLKILDTDDDMIDTFEYSKGTGPKFGIGFTGLPFVDINFEMRTIDYSTAEVMDGATGLKSDDDTGLKVAAYMLSLSIPLNL
ncbi:MAG: outer membrane beta-barrel protein [Bacteriovoracia bacterium]